MVVYFGKICVFVVDDPQRVIGCVKRKLAEIADIVGTDWSYLDQVLFKFGAGKALHVTLPFVHDDG